MRIVIAGCGRVGSDLALTLAEEGHDVSVIDNRPGAHARLGSTFNGTTHVGLGYDVEILKEAGIEVADAFVAATDSDNANAMAVQVAKRLFGVPRAVARLDDPAREDAYRALEVDFVAGAKLTSKMIREHVLRGEYRHHVAFQGGEVEVIELIIGPKGHGTAVRDLEASGDARVAAVYRDHETMIPSGAFTLEAGDLVVASATVGAEDRMKQQLGNGGDRS